MKFAVVALTLLTGCGEQWYAWDEIEVPFSGPGTVTLRVTTTPEAFPERLTDAAVRGLVDVGRLRLLDPGHDTLQEDPRWLNVLDAWDDCAPGALCVETLHFAIDCREECEGTLLFDAFLATNLLPEPDRGGRLTLELMADSGDDGVAVEAP